MSRTIRRALVATALAAGISGSVAGTAFADTSTTSPTAPTPGAGRLALIQQRAQVAIATRLSALHVALTAVNTNPSITASDKTTLTTTLNGDLTGLSTLGQKIQADTTASQALADYQTIFSGYRVFALALPKVRYAAACDDVTAGVLPRLNDANARLSALLAGPDQSKDLPPVQAAMQDLATQLKNIATSTTGLSASVLALTPAEWNANHAILAGPRQTLEGVRADVHAARQDVITAVTAIKS
jgi:hypothetical protein